MKTDKKEMRLNSDVYQIFSGRLFELQGVSRGEPQSLLFELQGFLDSGATDVEGFFEKFLALEKAKKLDALTLGVVYFFLARIYSRRKEFALSLSLLEKSEAYLAEENQELSLLIGKETYVLKMAYRYSDN